MMIVMELILAISVNVQFNFQLRLIIPKVCGFGGGSEEVAVMSLPSIVTREAKSLCVCTLFDFKLSFPSIPLFISTSTG